MRTCIPQACRVVASEKLEAKEGALEGCGVQKPREPNMA